MSNKTVITNIEVIDNPGKTKRLKATLNYSNGKTKAISFGMRDSKGTFYDIGDRQKRLNYIRRHGEMGEDWTDITTPGYWSRWFLWEKYGEQATRDFMKKKTGVNNITIDVTKYS
jgi:hypothetical protein